MKSFKEIRLQRATARAWKLMSALLFTGTVFTGAVFTATPAFAVDATWTAGGDNSLNGAWDATQDATSPGFNPVAPDGTTEGNTFIDVTGAAANGAYTVTLADNDTVDTTASAKNLQLKSTTANMDKTVTLVIGSGTATKGTTLTLSGTDNSVSANSTIDVKLDGTLATAAGAVLTNAGTITNAGTLTTTGAGTIGGAGDVNNSDTWNIAGTGANAITGTLTNTNAGTIKVTATDGKLLGAGTLDNQGNITVDGSADSAKLTLGAIDATKSKNTGDINVNAGAGTAKLDIAASVITGLGNINLNGATGKAATLTTAATFVNDGGTITSNATGTANVIDVMTTNNGNINVASGALTAAALTKNTGVITLSKDTTLTTDTVAVTNDGTLVINGDAMLASATGFTATDVTGANNGTIDFNAGKLTSSVTSFANQNLNFNGGTVETGALTTLSGVGATANKVSIDLSAYTDTVRNDNTKALMTSTGTVVTSAEDLNVNFLNTDKVKNGAYDLVHAAGITDTGAVDEKFRNLDLQTYTFGIVGNNLQLAVTTNSALLNQVVGDATSDKIGDGQSDFIRNLIDDNLNNDRNLTNADVRQLAQDLRSRALDPVRLSRAAHELNGAINEAAQTYNILASAQIFNSAIADLVTDYAIQQSVGTSVFGTSRDRGAMGGRPTGATGSGSDSYATGFVKAYGGFGSQGGIGGMPGYDFQNVGALIGAGYRFARELELGGLFGYSYNTAEAYHGYGEANDHTLRLGLYGNLNYDNFFFNTTPTFGIHLLSSERYFRELGYGTAKSDDRTGFDFSWSNRLGYVFELPANFFLTPS
jgi:hypothetical protein